MPRKQSKAAKMARRFQREGDPRTYTALLRAVRGPEAAFVTALGTAGLATEQRAYESVLRYRAKLRVLDDVYGQAEVARYEESRAGITSPRYLALARAADEAGQALEACVGGDPYADDREVLHIAARALAHAGAVTDGRLLAEATSRVLPAPEDTHQFLWLSDAIRHGGQLNLPPLDGPPTPRATAARQAAELIAAASRIRFCGDEEWTACAQLLEDAVVLTRSAAAMGAEGPHN